MDFVKYLLDKHGCSPDSSNGYFLARAVFAKHIELVDLLLSYGASPDMNDGWAVRNAISDGDLAMVRRLLELTPPSTSEQEDSLCTNDYERDDKAKKRRRSDADKSSPRKRRKVEMRCKPTPKMLSTAVQAQQWPIVDYLTSKGAPSCPLLREKMLTTVMQARLLRSKCSTCSPERRSAFLTNNENLVVNITV